MKGLPNKSEVVKVVKGESPLILPVRHAHHHSGHKKSVRIDHYKGREIRVETSYNFFIDGEDKPLHVNVMDNGRVSCHDLPQYSTKSALDLLRRIVDLDDIETVDDELNRPHDSGHDHHDPLNS